MFSACNDQVFVSLRGRNDRSNFKRRDCFATARNDIAELSFHSQWRIGLSLLRVSPSTSLRINSTTEAMRLRSLTAPSPDPISHRDSLLKPYQHIDTILLRPISKTSLEFERQLLCHQRKFPWLTNRSGSRTITIAPICPLPPARLTRWSNDTLCKS